MNLTEGIWDRAGYGSMGKNLYATAVSLAFSWTVGLVAISASITYSWQFSWPLLIGTFIASIVAIFIFHGSDNWPISLFGVSVMSVALGMMIGPSVALYSADVVVKALLTTLGITLVMSVIGAVIPQSLEGLGSVLMGALMLLIVGNLARIFMPMFGIPGDPLSILDWVGAGVFTIYIMYDWNRAMRLPHTLDNAIDVSGALILDVVNLFLYLLRLYARNDD